MEYKYTTLIRYDENNCITKITCPILLGNQALYDITDEKELNASQTVLWQERDIQSFIQDKLHTRLTFLKNNNYEIPTITDTEEPETTGLETVIYVHFQAEKKVFQKFFYLLAITTGTLSSINYGLLSILAIELATSANFKLSSQILPVTAALLSALMYLTMFIFSDAIHNAEEFGKKIDNYFFRSPIKNLTDVTLSKTNALMYQEKHRRCLKALVYLFFAILTIGDVTGKTIVFYETILSLEKALLTKDALASRGVIILIAATMAIIHGISLTFFEWSFAVYAGENFYKKIETSSFYKKNSSILSNQLYTTEPNTLNTNNLSKNYRCEILIQYTNNRITKITCPILFGHKALYDITENTRINISKNPSWQQHDIKHFIQDEIHARLTLLKNNNYEVPTIKETRNQENTTLKTAIYVHFQAEKKVFQKIFYTMAITAGTLSSINYGLLSILAFELAASSDVKLSSQVLPMTAAILSALMYFIVFIFSDAIHNAEDFGKKIDNYFFRNPIKNLTDIALSETHLPMHQEKHMHYLKAFVYLFFAILTINDVACTTMAFYQTTISLGQSAFQKDNAIIPIEAIMPMAIITSIITVISAILFEASFAVTASIYALETIENSNYLKQNNNYWAPLNQEENTQIDIFNADEIRHELFAL